MRRRKKPWAKDRLLEYENYVIQNPEELKGKWKSFLKTDTLHVELGTGRGQFITTHAGQNKDKGYIGIEIKEEVLLNAVEKAEANRLDNIVFLWFNIDKIEYLFDENEIDRIYINFCDPWPKKRHAKRRLTHRNFLKKYMKLLKKSGEIHFKTDNEELFEFSLNEFSAIDFRLKNISLSLYRDENSDTVTTEYEDKFVSMGMNIYRLEAVNPK